MQLVKFSLEDSMRETLVQQKTEETVGKLMVAWGGSIFKNDSVWALPLSERLFGDYYEGRLL